MFAPAKKDVEHVRASKRTKTFVIASVVIDDESRPARIRNLSTFGARLELLKIPPVKSKLILQKGKLQASCNVVWVSPTACGVRFEKPIELLDWLRLKTTGRSDDLLPNARYDTDDPLDDQSILKDSAQIEQVLKKRVAEEISYVNRVLEASFLRFAQDSYMIAKYAIDLQSLDAASSTLAQLHLALDANDGTKAAAQLKETSLRRRVLRMANPPTETD